MLTKTMTFDEVVSLYLEAKRHEIRSHERNRYALNRLTPHFRGRQVKDLKRADVRQYIQHRQRDGVQPATINRELDLLSAAINFVSFSHEIELPNPVHKMSLREPEGRVRWISRQEADRLIDAARSVTKTPHLVGFIQLALHTGCRKSELLTLEWRQIHLDRAFLQLEGAKTKNRKRRLIPLNAAGVAVLQELQAWTKKHYPESPWVFNGHHGNRITTLQRRFEAARRVAKLEDFRIHDLRHTCASWLVMSGVSLPVVRDLLGHHSVGMTERYAHLAPTQVVQAVNLLLNFG